MKKIKDFILYFGWLLGFETISADLGFTSMLSGWSKYLTPVVFGSLFAFVIFPLKEKKKAEENKVNF